MMASDLELQLLSALEDSDSDSLACRLSLATSSGTKLTAELLSSMLIEAIERKDSASVKLLVEEFGADPCPFIKDGSSVYPLITAIRLMEREDSLIDRVSSSDFKKATEIVKFLLKFPNNFMRLPEDKSRYPLLECLFSLSTLLSESSLSVIQNLSSKAINYCHLPNAITPMAAVIYRLADYDGRGVSISSVHRVLNYAIIPLLKSGALMKPDIFEKDGSLAYRSRIEEFCRVDAECSQAIYDRPNVLMSILIEARGLSSLPQLDFANIFVIDDDLSQRCLKEIPAFMRSQFPRSLQTMARSAILRHLPLGYERRAKAITDLLLPQNLSSFLSFDEFYTPRVYFSSYYTRERRD